MIQCPQCGTQNPDDAQICLSCGRALRASDAVVGTTSLLNSPLTGALDQAILKPVPTTPSTIHRAHVGNLPEHGIAIYVGESVTPIIHVIKDRSILGRGKDTPDPNLIDLMPFDAYKFGVSRTHASLTFIENKLYIRDEGSMNGTWISNTRINPNVAMSVDSGTVVTVGHMILCIYY